MLFRSHILCAYALLNIVSVALLLGGIRAGISVLVLGLIMPILALLLLGPGAGKFWLAGNLTIVGVVSFFSLMYFIRQRDEFQRKSDDLLRNILPDEIAERLKDSSAFIAEHFAHASVLFADVVAFTPMSSQMSLTELVALLNEVFSEFDQLVERHGLEKIKTIGDCYMVAAGVPQPRADHAQTLTQLALEICRRWWRAATSRAAPCAFALD